MLGTSASYGRKLPGFELWGALLMNPQRGCLEPVLATAGVDYAWHWRGVHRERSQSPGSAPAPTADERWARCGILRTPLVSIAAIFARVDL